MTPAELEAIALARGGTVTPVRTCKLDLQVAAAKESLTVQRASLRPTKKMVPPVYCVIGFVVLVPILTASEANRRDHWGGRHRRMKAARVAWEEAVARHGPSRVPFPCRVTFTRLGGRRMDDDNLAGSMKGLRDAIADWLGVDDGSGLYEFRYAQEPGGMAGVRVKVETIREAA